MEITSTAKYKLEITSTAKYKYSQTALLFEGLRIMIQYFCHVAHASALSGENPLL